jgi:cytochrome b subunit of formate dehydrogenase
MERFTVAERSLHWATVASVAVLLVTGTLVWLDLDHFRPSGINVVVQTHALLGGGGLLVAALAFCLFRRRHVVGEKKRLNTGQNANLRVMQLLLLTQAVLGTTLYFGRALHLTKPRVELIGQIHFIVACVVVLAIAAHMVMVFVVRKNQGIFEGMWTGFVSRKIAERSCPDWVKAVDAAKPH